MRELFYTNERAGPIHSALGLHGGCKAIDTAASVESGRSFLLAGSPSVAVHQKLEVEPSNPEGSPPVCIVYVLCMLSIYRCFYA